MINIKINVAESSAAQDAYRKFFQKKLKDYGVSSPSQLSADDKASFFNDIKKDWSKKKTAASDTPYKKHFRKVLKDFGVNSPAELPEESRDEFFQTVDEGWDAGDNETDID